MGPITPTHYVLLSAALFMVGVFGVLTRRNIIIIFMSIELILNAFNINLVAFSYQLQNGIGQVFAIFVIAVAAAVPALLLLAVFWRPDKQPADCRYDQLEVTTAYELAKVFGAGGRRRG